MSIYDTLDFQPMFITDALGSMRASSAWYDKSKLNPQGERTFPFVSRTKESNGVDGLCSRQEKDPEPGNAITIGLDTQTIGYQPTAFYTSQNIQVLRDPKLSAASALVLAALIRQQMVKFGWGGNGATLGRLKKTQIMLPVTTDANGEQVPDWDGMTRLGEELFTRVAADAQVVRRTSPGDDDTLPDLKFEPILVTSIFQPHKGKRLIAAHRQDGDIPFVGGSELNNSITGYSDVDPLFPGGWLTLVYNGSVGQTRYQPAPFFASDDVIALEPLSDAANEDALLVLAAIIQRESVGKYSYGTKLNLGRLERQTIMVPVTTDADGETVVDWGGMTQYGRALRVRAERALDPVLGSTA